MIKAFKSYWKNYFNFSGVSSVSDYWWMFFINTFIFFIFIVAFGGLGSFQGAKGFTVGAIIGLVIGIFYSICAVIPSISLLFRRYRDAGVSPWWLLVTIILPSILNEFSHAPHFTWLSKVVFIIQVVNFIILVMPSQKKGK